MAVLPDYRFSLLDIIPTERNKKSLLANLNG